MHLNLYWEIQLIWATFDYVQNKPFSRIMKMLCIEKLLDVCEKLTESFQYVNTFEEVNYNLNGFERFHLPFNHYLLWRKKENLEASLESLHFVLRFYLFFRFNKMSLSRIWSLCNLVITCNLSKSCWYYYPVFLHIFIWFCETFLYFFVSIFSISLSVLCWTC